MYQALYRKYRPKTFDDVIGQEHITTVLKNEIATGRIAHAYLFTGSRGTGKTSCARIVAKAINCENPQGGNPCGVCPTCRYADEGRLMDIIEIDAATNSGVDSIRDLRDDSSFTPGMAKYRVYIIDEVHMLSTSAFNALLKIMEEPPQHLIFILATTEIHKVLPTIISRCQRFDFKRISVELITGLLMSIALKEGITITEEAARLIARLSEGGMRDAQSLLDVCSAHSQELTIETVAAAMGLAGEDHLLSLTDLIIDKNITGFYTALDELIGLSLDPQRLCEQMIGHYRDLMLAKTVADPADLVNCLPSQLPALLTQAARCDLGQILYALSILQDCLGRISRTALKRSELEMAAVRLCDPSVGGQTLQTLVRRVEELEMALKHHSSAVAKAPAAPIPVAAAAPKQTAKVEPDSLSTLALESEPSSAPEGGLFSQWPQVLERLGTINPTIRAVLAGSAAHIDGDRLLIECADPLFLTMIRENEYTRESIKRAISEVTGKRYPIGPYRSQAPKEEATDVLEQFISSLPQDDNITIR